MVAATSPPATKGRSPAVRSTAAASTGSNGGFVLLVLIGLTVLGLAMAAAARLLPGRRMAVAADVQRASMPADSRYGPSRRVRAAIAGIHAEEITVVVVAVVLSILVGLVAGRI